MPIWNLHRFRGFSGPVAATGESATSGRIEALRAASTPFVGRDEEMALLVSASRASCRPWPNVSPAKPHTGLSCFCSPHHQDSALHPSSNSSTQRDFAVTWGQRLDKLKLSLANATDIHGKAVLIAGLFCCHRFDLLAPRLFYWLSLVCYPKWSFPPATPMLPLARWTRDCAAVKRLPSTCSMALCLIPAVTRWWSWATVLDRQSGVRSRTVVL